MSNIFFFQKLRYDKKIVTCEVYLCGIIKLTFKSPGIYNIYELLILFTPEGHYIIA